MRVVPFSKLLTFHGKALLHEVASRSWGAEPVQPPARSSATPSGPAQDSQARFERLERTAQDYFKRGTAYVATLGLGRHEVAGGATVNVGWVPGLADRVFPNGVVARGRPDRYAVRLESARGTVSLWFHPDDPENLDFQTPDLTVSRRRTAAGVVIELISASDVKTLTRHQNGSVSVQRRVRQRLAA